MQVLALRLSKKQRNSTREKLKQLEQGRIKVVLTQVSKALMYEFYLNGYVRIKLMCS